jgi:hypothetical protein
MVHSLAMGSDGASMIDNNTTSGQTLSVWVGCPDQGHGWTASDPLLIVEADAEKAELLQSQLQPNQDVSIVVEVLAANRGHTVLWHRFNDARLNGPMDATFWLHRYPNLRHIGSEQRSSSCLADLLNDWIASRQSQTEPALHLHLKQGVPIDILEGLASWIGRLERVDLALPAAASSWAPQLDAWLGERGFAPVAERPGTWRRDPLSTAVLLLHQRDQQILELSSHQSELERQRDAALLREAELIAQRDAQEARAVQLQEGMESLIGEIVQIRSLIDQAVDHDPAAAEITIPPPVQSDERLPLPQPPDPSHGPIDPIHPPARSSGSSAPTLSPKAIASRAPGIAP